MQSTPAHDHANPDLLAVMPSVERVIEVGCSRGALASAYKRQHPHCHYLGIEVDANSAAVARAHCDAVMEGDIEQLLSSGALNHLQPAQCWVFGDTLEHLRDPWQTLRAIRAVLSPEGHVCACIPNMQHWSIQVRLNTGNLDYAESGLLDRTHLRWFTRTTMERLFENSGYSIERILPRIFEHPHNEAALNLVGQFAAALGHNADQARQDALPLQYVIKAAPLATSPGAAAQR
jgi:SAM-dependent methyltransferase